jgi:hypothetical protein
MSSFQHTFCMSEISATLSSSKDFPRPLFSDENNAPHIPRPTSCATVSWLHPVKWCVVGCFPAPTCARVRTTSSRPCAFHFTNPSRTARMQNAKMRDRRDAIQMGALWLSVVKRAKRLPGAVEGTGIMVMDSIMNGKAYGHYTSSIRPCTRGCHSSSRPGD